MPPGDLTTSFCLSAHFDSIVAHSFHSKDSVRVAHQDIPQVSLNSQTDVKVMMTILFVMIKREIKSEKYTHYFRLKRRRLEFLGFSLTVLL